MPRNKESKFKHIQQIIKKYRKDVFKTDCASLMWNVSNKNIYGDRKS